MVASKRKPLIIVAGVSIIFLVLIFLAQAAGLFDALKPTPEEIAAAKVRQAKVLVVQRQNVADQLVYGHFQYTDIYTTAQNGLMYIKDPRANICFAFTWGGSAADGGPVLATVPCESIPAEMLYVAKPPQGNQ